MPEIPWIINSTLTRTEISEGYIPMHLYFWPAVGFLVIIIGICFAKKILERVSRKKDLTNE